MQQGLLSESDLIPGTVSNEAEAGTGKTQKERELVFYARLANPAILKEAISQEDQEQWEIRIPHTEKNAVGGRMRVRMTISEDGTVSYVRTTKIKRENPEEGDDETPMPSTGDEFLQFKRLSEQGMIKKRYEFTASTGGRWEVDTYKESPWVRMEYEFPDDPNNKEEPAFLPGFVDIIDPRKATDAQQAIIRHLFETVFITKNPALRIPSYKDNK